MVNVDYCTASGVPYAVTSLPTGTFNNLIAVGNHVDFNVNVAGIGHGSCTAFAGSGEISSVPGYDSATGLVTFPGGTFNNGGSITCTAQDGTVTTRTVPNTGATAQTFDMSTYYSAASAGTIQDYHAIQKISANELDYVGNAPVLTAVGVNNGTAGTMILHTVSLNSSINNYGEVIGPDGFVHVGAAVSFFDTGGAFNDRGSNDTAGLIPNSYLIDSNNGTSFRVASMGADTSHVFPFKLTSSSTNFSVNLDSFSSDNLGKVTLAGLTTVDQAGNLIPVTVKVASARRGTFVCTGGGTITISNANMAVGSDVIISMRAQGGTITIPPAMKTVTASTGFTVLCGATDTSTYQYSIQN
jgi:hypothetical protein